MPAAPAPITTTSNCLGIPEAKRASLAPFRLLGIEDVEFVYAEGLAMGDAAKSETLGDLRPPAFRAVPPANVDEFFKRAEVAKVKVDQARVKEPAPGGLFSEPD